MTAIEEKCSYELPLKSKMNLALKKKYIQRLNKLVSQEKIKIPEGHLTALPDPQNFLAEKPKVNKRIFTDTKDLFESYAFNSWILISEDQVPFTKPPDFENVFIGLDQAKSKDSKLLKLVTKIKSLFDTVLADTEALISKGDVILPDEILQLSINVATLLSLAKSLTILSLAKTFASTDSNICPFSGIMCSNYDKEKACLLQSI